MSSRPPAPGLRSAHAAVWGLAAVLALAAGCGLKTAPQPLSTILPSVQGLRAWQQGAGLRLSWPDPGGAAARRYGGLEGFEVAIEARPGPCVDCELPDAVTHELAADAPRLERGSGRVFVTFAWPEGMERLQVRLRVEYGAGLAPSTLPVVAERAGRIPGTELGWRWADGGGDESPRTGARAVLLYWQQPLEGTERTLGPDGRPHESERRYGANVYRRVAPAPWPPGPLNGEPLRARQWIVPPLQAEFPARATGEEFRVRLVDRFGNEGPASPPVRVPLTGRRP